MIHMEDSGGMLAEGMQARGFGTQSATTTSPADVLSPSRQYPVSAKPQRLRPGAITGALNPDSNPRKGASRTSTLVRHTATRDNGGQSPDEDF